MSLLYTVLRIQEVNTSTHQTEAQWIKQRILKYALCEFVVSHILHVVSRDQIWSRFD
jgi:hypothetical protein